MAELTLERLRAAVGGEGAAIRVVTRLQPAGGAGDKVFPPTYQGGKYVYEFRYVDGEEIRCVLLDSVQSQANRHEEALLEAQRQERLKFPSLEVNFADVDLPQYGTISVLEAPHRIADAILRDSTLDGQPFRRSAPGRKFVESSPGNATGLLELCPTALVFGAWDSTGLGTSSLGAKFARTIISEIIGVGVVEGSRAAVRVDPLGIEKDAATIYKSPGPFGWTTEAERAERDSKGNPVILKRGNDRGGRPSVINHGNVITDILAGGVTFRYALQTTVLSLAGLRKLRFPGQDVRMNPERDLAGRTYLAALGLCAITLQQEAGYDLRSRCILVPENRRAELVPSQVGPAVTIEMPVAAMLELYWQAVEGLRASGFTWEPTPVILRPGDELVLLVRKNLEKIAAGIVDES